MHRRWGSRRLGGVRSAVVLAAVTALLSCSFSSVAGATGTASITIPTDQLASQAPFMGLGVQWDPYDTFQPTATQWNLIFQRLDFMRPGFFRVVESAYDYFGGYDANHNPVYRWNSPHVVQLRTILEYAKSRGIPVVLGDWLNPLLGGDARIPAGFLEQLHDVYGFTNIAYYNLMNEPNNNGASCDFGCWTNIVRSLTSEFTSVGLTRWLSLVGPDNANSWDDTAAAQAIDRTSGLDADNPIGGDSWVTATLQTIPGLIGAYDSHRYATIWGVEHGVYADQMRTRREQISNADSPAKPYFAGEVGLTARQITPFSWLFVPNLARLLAPLIDPSVSPRIAPFVDSQPHIQEFGYGVWMGDMMIQAIAGGLSGASAWDLDDAMHVGGEYGSQNLKRWGFWNTLGGRDGYPVSDLQLRPWFYTWSVLARSFPARSQPLVVPSTGVAGVRVAAAKIAGPNGRYYLSFAIVNDSDTPHSLRLSVPSATDPITLARYDYFAGDRPVDANGLPVPAGLLQNVSLSGSVAVQLPSRGAVVLSSLEPGSSVVLHDGRASVSDGLSDWSKVYARSKSWRLDHGNPVQFNDDGSRATLVPKAKGTQFLIYRANQITSFRLKAYYRKSLGVNMYRSLNGASWTQVPITSTNPAPALGGGNYLAEVLPNEPIPAGTNQLKVVVNGTGTELGEVAIQAGRVEPGCLPRGLPVGSQSLGGLPVGASQRRVLWLFGAATRQGLRVWRYCVLGGGQVAFVFQGRSGATLIASSAPGARSGGIGPGSPVASLRRNYGHGGLRSIRGGVYVASGRQGQLVFVTAAGRVRAVAVAGAGLLHNAGSLAHAVRLAGL